MRTDRPPSPGNPHYVRVTSKAGSYGITNDGFRSVSVEAGKRYVVTMLARRVSGTAGLTVGIENARMEESGSATIASVPAEWGVVTATITPPVTNTRARFRVRLEGPGAVDLDMVSLMPADTWKGRPNGLRADLVQLLADLKPGFLRFPGGCIVEGRYLETRYEWKKTIGAPADRQHDHQPLERRVRPPPAPDYFQSFGLGFFEYFQLSEDIGAEPLPILNCGMACQFNTSELVPLDELDPYMQDALDLIEFANGPATSAWGKRRADMGHPEPFNLKMLGVGNEQWGPQYVERYAVFPKTLKAKHPEIKLIVERRSVPAAASGSTSCGRKLRELGADIVDEHYYMPPAWFLSNANRYDNYPRTGPKVFVGEYAAHENVPHGAPGSPEQPERRARRGRVHDRPRAQRRRRADGLVRAAVRARRRLAVVAEPDLVRQPALRRARRTTTCSSCSDSTRGRRCCRRRSAGCRRRGSRACSPAPPATPRPAT